MATEHPFLFYGAAPASWHGDSHAYELRLRDLPDEAARARLGSLLEEKVRGGKLRATPLEKWLFCGRHLLLDVEVTDETSPRWTLIHQLLGEVHALVPLDQVICIGVEEESPKDAWTIWSRKTRPQPAPGPGCGITFAPYERATDASLGEYAEDPVFERARLAVRLKDVLGPLEQHARSARADEIVATLIDPSPPVASGKLEESPAGMTVTGEGWSAHLDIKGGRKLQLVVDGAPRALPPEIGSVHSIAARTDGAGLWVSVAGGNFGKIPPTLWLVDLPSGTARKVADLDKTPKMNQLLPLDAHRVLVGSHAAFLFDLRREPALVARIDLPVALRSAAKAGRVALAEVPIKPQGAESILLGLFDDRIEVIGKIPVGFRYAAEIGGQLVGFAESAGFRVERVDEAMHRSGLS